MQDEIGRLEEYKERKQEILQEKEQKKKEIKQIEEIIEIIKKVKNIKENEKLEVEKIKLAENLKEVQNQRKKQLEEQLKIQKQEVEKQNYELNQPKQLQKSKKMLSIIILFVVSLLLEVFTILVLKNNILIGIFALTFILTGSLILLENRKQKKEKEKQDEKKQNAQIKQNLDAIEAEIKILQNNIEEQEKELQIQKDKIQVKENIEKENLKRNTNKLNEIDKLFEMQNIERQLENEEEEKNRQKLEYHSLELEENTISPKLEKIALLEEKMEELKQREEQLEKYNQAMEFSKEILEIAYQKMKQNITPKLTKQLSQNIEKISNGKYTKIHLSEDKGIIIEKENGEYIEAEKLSIGTIDQLYLSLRLAMLKELTQESMPIILDEAFAYYDEERLKNILQYLDNEFPNNQIIIFSCTNREKEILTEYNIKHKVIQI